MAEAAELYRAGKTHSHFGDAFKKAKVVLNDAEREIIATLMANKFLGRQVPAS